MKTIYFVRHGESQGNRSFSIQQNEHTELSSQGMLQAKEVALHLKKLPLDLLISSPFARAKATAEAVQSETGLPIEFSELFIERRRPGVQLRKRKNHPHWLWVQVQLALFGRREGYRHSDEETTKELLERAHRALAYLAARPEPGIAVFTHKTFMRAMYASMTFGEGVTGRMYLGATRTMHMRNTALMVATYDEVWKVKSWNTDAREL